MTEFFAHFFNAFMAIITVVAIIACIGVTLVSLYLAADDPVGQAIIGGLFVITVISVGYAILAVS